MVNRVQVGSDHRMLRARIRVKFQQERMKLFCNKPRMLKIDVSKKNEYLEELNRAFSQSEFDENNPDLDTIQRAMADSLIRTAKKFQLKRPSTSTKFSDVTLQLMKKLHLKTPSTTKEKIEYAELSKTVRKKQKIDINRWIENFIDDLTSQGRGFKVAEKNLQPRSHITTLEEKDGTMTMDREKIIERCREFYMDLYTSSFVGQTEGQQCNECNEVPEVTRFEVKEAMQQMKRNKSPGANNITVDLLKESGEPVFDLLAFLFSVCLKQGRTPKDWKNAVIILLHKKGDRTNLSNHRPISLLDCTYKLFSKIVSNRITRTLDKNQPIEQAGFRRGFSTIDHLQTINQLIEKTNEYQKPLAIAFIDYKKAFDSIETDAVMLSLREQGVEEAYIRILKYVYQNSYGLIRLHKDSRTFKMTKGVKQGDPISPKLFTACLESVFRKLNWKQDQKGIKIGDDIISNLRFADDIAIFGNSLKELKVMLEDLSWESAKVGLFMNFIKTKVMTNKFVTDKTRIAV